MTQTGTTGANSMLANTTGTSVNSTQFAQGGDDLDNLVAFGTNEQSDARFGSGQMRALFGIAGREGAEAAAQKARQAAKRQATVDAGTFARQTAGLDLSDRQKKLAGRRMSLNRALAESEAGSASRRGTTDKAINARRGAADLENALFGQEAAGMIDLANAEGQRRIQAENRKANKKANRNSMFGTIAGIGIGLLSLSSEKAKDKRGEPDKLLHKLRKTRVEKWNYKGEEREHIGPYAEEFNELFGVGKDHPHMINLIDSVGVALGAIKELDKKVESIRG